MNLCLLLLVALLQLGRTQNQCVREIRALKDDLQTEVRDTVRNTLTANDRSITREEIQEMVEDKATKEVVQSVKREVTTRTQLVIDTLASNQNITRQIISNKATKDDVRQSVSELLQAFNVTKDKMQAAIKAETESIVRTVLQNEIESLQNNTALLFQAQIQTMQTELQSVRNEILSLTGHIADIQNSTAQLLALLQITKPSTESPTTEQTTEQSKSTTTNPLYTCNGTPGWRQVVFINMTDTSYNCPPGLNLTSYSKRTCGRPITYSGGRWKNCSPTTFSVGGSEYSRVCGRIRGYQVGAASGFFGYSGNSQTIEGFYVDGVSLTHGPPGERNHIWTFAVGYTEYSYGSGGHHYQCPCDASSVVPPPFIGNDYFCESGLRDRFPGPRGYGVFFSDDPLWDGQNCTSTSTCCELNNPPWFTKNLPNPTSDDIELRLCFHFNNWGGHEDVALEIIELYIQ